MKREIRVVMVIPQVGYNPPDLHAVKNAFRDRKARIWIAASQKTDAYFINHKGEKIDPIPVNIAIKNVDHKKFDAVVFTGGNVNDYTYPTETSKHVRQLITRSLKTKRIVAFVGEGQKVWYDSDIEAKLKLRSHGGIQVGRPKYGGVLILARSHSRSHEMVAEIFKKCP